MSETSKKIGDFQGLCENLPEGIMNVIFHVIEWVLNGFSSKKNNGTCFLYKMHGIFPAK
jgi:hypothetical protein